MHVYMYLNWFIIIKSMDSTDKIETMPTALF